MLGVGDSRTAGGGVDRAVLWCSRASGASAFVLASLVSSALTCLSLLGLSQPAFSGADQHFGDADLTALHEYARQIRPMQIGFANARDSKTPHDRFYHPDLAALREYTQEIGADQPTTAGAPPLRVAEADSAIEALREFLRGRDSPSSNPRSNPSPAPQPAPRATPVQPRPASPKPNPAFIDAHHLGEKTCLMCHAGQAASFGKDRKSTRLNSSHL